jgi:hypothetical protein
MADATDLGYLEERVAQSPSDNASRAYLAYAYLINDDGKLALHALGGLRSVGLYREPLQRVIVGTVLAANDLAIESQLVAATVDPADLPLSLSRRFFDEPEDGRQ